MEVLKFAVLSLFLSIIVFWPVETINFSTNYNSLAVALKNRGDLVSAEAYYLKAIETDPAYPSPYYNMALLLEKTGRRQDALNYRQKYEELKNGQV